LNVLSQLDAPFLLTESPLVKASAIGRITGTHVIDNAVKEANKTIQGNKKIIKQYESDLADEENELKRVPDIAKMESLFVYLQTVQSYLKTECAKVDKCESNMDEYEQIAVQENGERSMLKAARNFSSLNAVPKLALPMIQWS
jgi:exonuclease SbcC